MRSVLIAGSKNQNLFMDRCLAASQTRHVLCMQPGCNATWTARVYCDVSQAFWARMSGLSMEDPTACSQRPYAHVHVFVGVPERKNQEPTWALA